MVNEQQRNDPLPEGFHDALPMEPVERRELQQLSPQYADQLRGRLAVMGTRAGERGEGFLTRAEYYAQAVGAMYVIASIARVKVSPYELGGYGIEHVDLPRGRGLLLSTPQGDHELRVQQVVGDDDPDDDNLTLGQAMERARQDEDPDVKARRAKAGAQELADNPEFIWRNTSPAEVRVQRDGQEVSLDQVGIDDVGKYARYLRLSSIHYATENGHEELLTEELFPQEVSEVVLPARSGTDPATWHVIDRKNE